MIFSQSGDDWNWGGLIRFRPLATVFSLALGGFEIVADWVPYVTPSIGIPIEIDIVTISGITGFGIMAGIEFVPVRHKEKSGLYLTAVGGGIIIDQYFTFIGRTNIGYQLVTNGGFVFTPAIGAKYNGITGIALDLMLDIGFAYRKR
jgi:hypothetical protein